MINQKVLAHCNLFAVLKNIEYLVAHDEESRDLVKGKNISILFKVNGGPCGQLSFKNGKAEMKEGFHNSSIILLFLSPQHFNNMIEGKANPIPLKGFTKIGFLTGTFKKLADRLTYFLRPTEDVLRNPEFFKMNTEMTFYTAFFALAQIANGDLKGIQNAKLISNGVIQVSIGSDLAVSITIKNGKLSATKGFADKPNARLDFTNLEITHGILSGKKDTYVALALGEISMKGFVPMIEHMNPILDLVSKYLA